MNTDHPTDAVIQQYVLDKTGCEPGIAAHIEACAGCRAAANAYRMLVTEIKQQPAPVFDFDLSALVIPQLVAAKPRFSWSVFILYVLAAGSAGAIGIIVYLFRKELLFIIKDIMPLVVYLIVLTTAAILLFQGMGMYKKYQKQMNRLNSH